MIFFRPEILDMDVSHLCSTPERRKHLQQILGPFGCAGNPGIRCFVRPQTMIKRTLILATFSDVAQRDCGRPTVDESGQNLCSGLAEIWQRRS